MVLITKAVKCVLKKRVRMEDLLLVVPKAAREVLQNARVVVVRKNTAARASDTAAPKAKNPKNGGGSYL